MNRTCKTCSAPFKAIANQQYCGNPCLSPTTKLLSRKPPPPVRPCERCGKHFQPTTPLGKFCSRECREARDQPPKWKLNPDFEYKDSTWRKYVLEFCGNVCADCGHAGPELHAHHIIPRSRGGKNVIRNGMALCADCHRLRHDPLTASDDLVERIARRVVEIIDNR